MIQLDINRDSVKEWVSCKYNIAKEYSVEIGTVLWGINGDISCEEFIIGKNNTQVNPYKDYQLKLVKDMMGNKFFLGDYHTHPANLITWASQFPSPNDLKSPSALSDFWKLDYPINGVKDLPISPKIQIIHCLVTGDFFLLQQTEGTPYSTLEEQEEKLSEIIGRYGSVHQDIGITYGAHKNSRYTLTDIVEKELPKIKKIIHPKAVISFYSRSSGCWF